MASLNKVMIIGTFGRDPEVNYTQGGTAICNMSLATSEKWKDKNTGENKEKTEWHRVKAFGPKAETISRYMSKGRQIYVEGKLQTSTYEKDGITRYSTEIIIEAFQFIGQKQDNQNNQPQGGYNQGYQRPAQPQGNHGYNQGQGGFDTPPDDDVPF